MNAPSGINLFELLNFCLQQHPEALGIFALNPRVVEVRMPRKPAPSGGCFHQPSGEEDAVGVLGGILLDPADIERVNGQRVQQGCWCGNEHSRKEKCARCGEWVLYHEFPGREPRVTLLTVELPERVGQNLKGPEEGHAFLVAFSIDRAVYDSFVRRASSPIILSAGALT